MKIKIPAIVFLIFTASCSTSSITHSWRSDNISKNNYTKILVVGLSDDRDRNMREQMENHLAGDLAAMGYNAISSFKVYGPKSFENSTEKEVLSNLDSIGVDAVITVVLLDKKSERYYVPHKVYRSPYRTRFGYYNQNFWAYYSTTYSHIYTPGYYQVDTRYFWESNFYDMGKKQLLYSVQTRSFNPSSTESLAHEYGKMIVKDMVKQGIVSAKMQGK
jgi:hypothetical protein